MVGPDLWPELSYDAWRDTYATLHRYLQVIGKVRLALAPMENHWWQVPLYVTARGLTTSPIPYNDESFEVELDFFAHAVDIRTSWGVRRELKLRAQPVSDFYRDFMAALASLGIEVNIWDVPVEIMDGDKTPFHEDRHHAAYNPEYVHRLWRVLASSDAVFKQFHAGFNGKASPVHFFWGGFDLATTRFSGRPAPPRPGADLMTREGYREELMSVGFWPGSVPLQLPLFYAYASPEPKGFAEAAIRPPAAYYEPKFLEYVLPYDVVRAAPSPRDMILDFCRSTYDAAAALGGWDRSRLEQRPLVRENVFAR